MVDIGEPEESVVDSAAATITAAETRNGMSDGAETFGSTAVPANNGVKDTRIDDVVSLLGEFMPSDPTSSLVPYLSGFMSLRLLFLRSSRTPEEEELARTMLDSYSSYSAGGRARSDIAIMLARDFMFLSQQSAPVQQQQNSQQSFFLGLGQAQWSKDSGSSTGVSRFGLPSTSMSDQDSPVLYPISIAGTSDSLSIVSNN